MHASANGRADIVGPPIELGDFMPERREVVLNGQKYLGWVTTNRRYPRNIMIKLDRAARMYNKWVDLAYAPLAEGEEPSPEQLEALDLLPEKYGDYVTESVRLLVPSVLESELDLVPLEVLRRCGQELGYLPPDEVGTTDITPAEAAETETPLTGDSSQPSSPDSTPAMELTSS